MASSTPSVPQPNPNAPEQQSWQRVLARLRFRHGEATFNSWLKGLELQELESHRVMLSAPTRFIREWVLTHYAEDLLQSWREEAPDITAVSIAAKKPAAQRGEAEKSQAPGSVELWKEAHNVQAIGSPLDPRFTFDNFVVGTSNELAHAAARSVAESQNVPGSNPLFLHGGVGLGKTHLMHAIAWHIAKTAPARNVIYLSAEKFMYLFIRALRDKNIMQFKEQFRSVDVLMIDDVQFICGKGSTQEEFFHTFNALIDNRRQLVISADRSPSDLDGMEERIRSRLGWGLVADINTTTYELRLGILQSKVDQMQVDVPQEVLAFLAHKISSNVRELEGALNKVVAHSKLVGKRINMENTQQILCDLLRANQRVVTIDDIKKAVCDHCNVRVADLHSDRRARYIARPRQIAMYLSKKLTTHSLPEIGRKFGGRDHTTVMHAVKRVEELVHSDPEIAEDVELLTRMLSS